MKALSLSLNIIIVLVATTMIISAIAAFMYKMDKGATVNNQIAWNEACQKARQLGCKKTTFEKGSLMLNDINGDGYDDDIIKVCKAQFGYTDNDQDDIQNNCWQQCCGNF